MLFYITFKMNEDAKGTVFDMFGSMTEADDEKDKGPNIVNVTRLMDLGEGSGMGIAEADSAEEVYAWAYNWATLCTVSIKPVVTDEEARRIIKKEPKAPHVPLKPIEYNDADGMIFYGTWQIHQQHKAACFSAFGGMGPEEDKKDAGPNNKLLLRVSDMGSASGCWIFQAKSLEDAYAWCYNWAPMAQLSIKPMVNDKQARAIIQAKKAKSAKAVGFTDFVEVPLVAGSTAKVVDYMLHDPNGLKYTWAQKGNISATGNVYTSAEGVEMVAFYGEWESKEDFDAYFSSEGRTNESWKELCKLFAGPPKITSMKRMGLPAPSKAI